MGLISPTYLPQLQLNWQQRLKRPLPDSVKFALGNFERVWIADGSTLEALFRKLKSLEDFKTGQLAGKICTVIDERYSFTCRSLVSY